MRRLKRFLAQEDGIAMATVVAFITVMTVLSAVLIDQVTHESNSAASATVSDGVYQAAEAGVNDYIAKLTDDPVYYDHYLAKGESTRTPCTTIVSGACTAYGSPTVSDGGAWSQKGHWAYRPTTTFPDGKDKWFTGTGTTYSNSTVLGSPDNSTGTMRNGYAYNLEITPPSSALGTNYITIVSTGCKVKPGTTLNLPAGSADPCDTSVAKRVIEVRVRRSTPADFQFMMKDMSGANVCWASKIYGRMYSTGNINVCGATSYGNMMAEGYVTGTPTVTMVSPSRIYDKNHPDIRTVVKNPISFDDLKVSTSDIKRAAALNSPSTDFEDASASAWRVIFSSASGGTVTVWKCVGSTTPASSQPFCGPDTTLSASTTLPKTGGFPATSITINTSSSTDGFPSSGTIYVGPSSSGGRIDTVTYGGKTSTSFTQCYCSTCGSSTRTHAAGETVSGVSGGITWASPMYSGATPANGAIYTGQDAIVSWPTAISGYTTDGSSVVNGRVTLATGGDIIVGGNIHYQSETNGNPDDDVLGLIAQSDVWMAKYAPDVLWWRAATIALTGLWGDYRCVNGGGDRSNSSLTFVGTSAYASNSGCIHSDNGGYNINNTYRITDDGTAPSCPSTAPNCMSYDALKFLFPPWFPVINGLETTVLFREMPSTYKPLTG